MRTESGRKHEDTRMCLRDIAHFLQFGLMLTSGTNERTGKKKTNTFSGSNLANVTQLLEF